MHPPFNVTHLLFLLIKRKISWFKNNSYFSCFLLVFFTLVRSVLELLDLSFKGTMPQEFWAVLIFFKNSQRDSLLKVLQGVVDTGGKWKKSSIRKVSIILFGHLYFVEFTFKHIFSLKITLMCKQSDIVIII